MLRNVCVTLAAIVLSCGCDTSKPSSSPDAVQPSTNNAKQQADPSPAEGEKGSTSAKSADHSLTTDQYVKLGLPAIDRPWSSSEMSRAAKVLTEIAKRDAQELPRYQSPKSGKVFARITSDENLESVKKKSLPVSVRTGFALQSLHATTSIGKLYATADVEQNAAGDETTELLGQTLRIAVVLKELSDEVLPSLDKNDPTYAVRVKGLRQMTTGLGPVLQGQMTQALATKKLKPETRTRMLQYLDKTLPELVKVLPIKVRDDLRTKLKTLSERPEFAEHQQDFEPLLEKISQTLEEPTTNESDR